MKIKYPNLWVERNGSSYCNDDGEITPIAYNWIDECTKLTSDQIKSGIKNLASRKNAAFPPSAIEFISHCRKMGAEDCADEIFDYLNQPSESDWWWQSQVAFNVFKRLGYNPANNESKPKILDRIISIYGRMDMNNLDDLPIKPVMIPVEAPKKIDRDRGKFQAKMFGVIMRARPDLLGVKQDKKTTDLFTPHKSRELMLKWYGDDMPDMADFLRVEGIAV